MSREQEQVFDISSINKIKSDTNPMTDANNYLGSVINERDDLPDIVVAKPSEAKQSTFSIDSSLLNIFTENVRQDTDSTSTTRPPISWINARIADFSTLRQRIRRIKATQEREKKIMKINFPSIFKIDIWQALCFKSSLVTQPKSIEELHLKEVHHGTPPLLSVIFAMNNTIVQTLFTYLVDWLIDEDVMSKAYEHWIFALLVFVEKPLDADVCASMRQLARFCKNKRSTLAVSDDIASNEQLRMFGYFICLVAHYFQQNDLAD